MKDEQDHHNRGGLIAFLFSVSFCLVFFIYVSFIHPGVDLREVYEDDMASDEELLLAQKDLETPWISTDAVIAHGRRVYENNCAVCHGPGGKGDGPAGPASNPPARNLVEGNWQKGGSSIEMYKTLKDGIEGTTMASFSYLSSKDRWAMVAFVRSITDNLVPDDEEELEQYAATAN